MRRKNTKFIDPRYFMDEKTEKAPIKENRFTSAKLSGFEMSPAFKPSVAPPEPDRSPEERLSTIKSKGWKVIGDHEAEIKNTIGLMMDDPVWQAKPLKDWIGYFQEYALIEPDAYHN